MCKRLRIASTLRRSSPAVGRRSMPSAPLNFKAACYWPATCSVLSPYKNTPRAYKCSIPCSADVVPPSASVTAEAYCSIFHLDMFQNLPSVRGRIWQVQLTHAPDGPVGCRATVRSPLQGPSTKAGYNNSTFGTWSENAAASSYPTSLHPKFACVPGEIQFPDMTLPPANKASFNTPAKKICQQW